MIQDPVLALLKLRDELYIKQAGWNGNLIKADDFSYIDGAPKVLSWGEGARVHIGKFCSIAANVTFMLGGDHRNDWVSTYPFNAWLPDAFGNIKGHPHTNGDIIVGNDVWISRDAKIMSGVHIGDGATVAANAVVTKDVEPYAVVGGVPAKVLKMRFSDGFVKWLLKVKWWDWPIEKIAEAVPLLQSDDIVSLIKKHDDPSFYDETGWIKSD